MRMKNIKNRIHLFAKQGKLIGIERLGTVAHGFFGFVMDFDHQAVGLGSHCSPAEGNNLISPAGRMTGIHDDGQVALLSNNRYGRQVQGVPAVVGVGW